MRIDERWAQVIQFSNKVINLDETGTIRAILLLNQPLITVLGHIFIPFSTERPTFYERMVWLATVFLRFGIT